jgi:hypothetical protein
MKKKKKKKNSGLIIAASSIEDFLKFVKSTEGIMK